MPVNDIGKWLESLGLDQYADVFEENAIDEAVLPELTDADLEKIGVKLGHRKKLLKVIGALDSADTSTTPEPQSAVLRPASLASAPAEAERRQLTVMFCDLVGSTELSQRLDPEDLRELNGRSQDAWKRAIERYDGYIARYMGDGLLAYFGYPLAHEDDAERAIRAGLEIVDNTKGLEFRSSESEEIVPSVRVAIATGTVVVGDVIGEGASQESAVTGETPNLAARLQGLAQPDSVVVGEGTYELTRGRFAFRDCGAHQVKGAAEPIRMWTAVAETAAESRFDLARERGLTPLVGREDDVALLTKRWDRVADGEGQVVLLSGEPGIGKSRLANTLLQYVSRQSHIYLHYQCSPYHAASPLYPVVRELERAAEFEADDSADQRRTKISTLLKRSSCFDEQTMDLIIGLFVDTEQQDTAGQGTPQEQRRLTTLQALATRVDDLAKSQPIFLIFEDLHWIDPTSLELLHLIVERARKSRVMLILTFRPEFGQAWTGESHVTLLALARLNSKDSEAFVAKLIGTEMPPESIQRIAARTDGVPLFLEELTRSILEADPKSGNPAFFDAVEQPIPRTLQASLLARLDRLCEGKQVAQIGSVIGREFAYGLVSKVSGLAQESLNKLLEDLEHSGLVSRRGSAPDSVYVFKHALVQDAAYASLLNRTRRALHERVAREIERNYPVQVRAEPELLARHYAEAGAIEAAIGHWRRVLNQASLRSAIGEVAEHAQNALQVVPQLPKTTARDRIQLEFELALGVTYANVDWITPESVDALHRALELSHRLEDTHGTMDSLTGLCTYYFSTKQWQSYLDAATRVVEMAQATNERQREMIALTWRGYLNNYLGAFAEAGKDFERVLALEDDGGHFHYAFDVRIHARSNLAKVLWLQGYSEQACTLAAVAVARSRDVRQSYSRGHALHYYGFIRLMCEGGGASADLAKEFREYVSENDVFIWTNWLGALESLQILLDSRAGSDLRALIEHIRLDRGDARYFHHLPFINVIYEEFGASEECLQIVEDMLTQIEEDGQHGYESEVRRLRGELLLALDATFTEVVEREFRTAIDIAVSQQAKSWELRAAISLARLWRFQGRRRDAKSLLVPICDWFTEGFDTGDLGAAKAVLESLS